MSADFARKRKLVVEKRPMTKKKLWREHWMT
jgi:hypothetical protein